jgi:CRISPR-associated protein Csy1
MLDPAIQNFINERKAASIKKKIKVKMSEEEKYQVEETENEVFSLDIWLSNAAKRATQLSLVSHPSKFSHPSSKTSAIIASCTTKNDGFLRTGNIEVELDVFGNAAALDVYQFLSLILVNDKTVLRNLEENTNYIKAQFTLNDLPFQEIRSNLLKIKKGNPDFYESSGNIKQVYFPVDDDYHLLSLLTPSGLIFKLKERINTIKFSEQTKTARENKNKNQYDDKGFDELYNLTVIGFGGTKPQNISVLNSKNFGQSYLLSSLPPILKNRTIHTPKNNFFKESINIWKYKEQFNSFHSLIYMDYNNHNIRSSIRNLIEFIILRVIDIIWKIRSLESGWSEDNKYDNLPIHQKIFLDNKYLEEREEIDEWLAQFTDNFSRWFLWSYGQIMGEKKKAMGAENLIYIKEIIDNHKEGLK